MSMISPELLDKFHAAFQDNTPTRIKLPDGGRIHIDRQLPFLILYRRPTQHPDHGTDRLILGESAYVIADGNEHHAEALSGLLYTILDAQRAVFGASLLVEIWAGPELSDSAREPSFAIHAPGHASANLFLESMESALLKISINKQPASVVIHYPEQICTPGLAPMLSDKQAQALNCLHVGLEIAPIYRDSISGELLPFRLNKIHHKLARSLKRIFYAFMHHYTPIRPVHFHELGRRFMTQHVFDVDTRLADISARFDLLLHVTPVNNAAAWQTFSTSGFNKSPEFLYRPRPLDPSLVKRELYAIEIEQIDDPSMAYIFSRKREELDRQLTLVADRNTSRFLLGSRQLFGDVSPALLALAQRILELEPYQDTKEAANDLLDANDIAKHAREEFAYYKTQHNAFKAQVHIRDDITGILVSKGHFLVGNDARVTRERLQATLAHEISTHVLTYHNGSQQAFKELYAGMAGYESMQEGLAVLSEYLVGGITRARMRLLASRVLAVHMISDGADFIETYRQLQQEYGFEPYTAFTITMRVFRGGGYTKDMVYLLGLQNVLDYLAADGHIERLYVGKIAYEYRHIIDELCWRKVVETPRLLPRFLADEQSQARLQQVKQGLDVLSLARESL